MENLEKIHYAYTTYVCNIRPNGNYSDDDKILIGTINSSYQKSKHYKSLLQIHESDLKLHSANKVYIFLFVDNIHVTNNVPIFLSLSGNNDTFFIPNIDWRTFPKKSTNVKVDINISPQSLGKYIKIDVTKIIKSLGTNVNTYNILIEALHYTQTSMIQFGSCNCEKPPYFGVLNNPLVGLLPPKQDTFKISTSDNNMRQLETNNSSSEIINQLNTQNLKLDSLEKNLINIIDSLENKLLNIKNVETDLNNRIFTTFNQLSKNFSDVNNTITSIKDYLETLRDETNPNSESFPLNFLNSMVLELNELTKTEIFQLNYSPTKVGGFKV